MAFKVRKIDKIIADDIDTSEYGSKQEILDAAREIQSEERKWRNQELADEKEMKQQEDEMRRLYKSRQNPRSKINDTSAQRKLRASGMYKPCRGIFFGCNGTGYIGSLPHARCGGTGLIKVPKSKRRALFKKQQKRKRKSFFRKQRRRR